MKTKVVLSIALSLLITGATLAQGNEKHIVFELNGEASLATTKPGYAKLNRILALLAISGETHC